MATSTDFATGQNAAGDSAIKDLDQLYNQAKTGRAWLEPVWILNLAYYNGDQWLAWNGRQLFQPNLRPNRITIVDNRIQGCVRTEIAKMTKTRPVFTVAPGSASDEDVEASELGEQLMRFLWTHANCREITTKALLWSRICGAGFVKATWDSTVGESTEVLINGGNGKILQDSQGAPMYGGQDQADSLTANLGVDVRVRRVARGDIRVEAKSPFQVFPDPLADTFDECEWVIEECVKSVEYCRRVFNADLVADTPANPGMVEVKMGSFIPGSSPYKGVKLREYWCKPGSRFPNGRRVTWAQGKVLKEDDRPFDPFPYVMFSSIPVPGRLWPTCITEQLRGPQTELNKVKSQKAENRNRVGNPTLLASRQGIQDPEKFADQVSQPGGLAWVDVTMQPLNQLFQYLEPPSLPDYVAEEEQNIIASIEAISGQHEVSNGQVPPGVTAASAITQLQEADDTRLGPGVTDYEEQLAKLGQKMMDLAANFYTDDRVCRIAGEDGAWEIFSFRGAMLKGNTHVQVQTGSAFPQSKAARQAALMDLLRMLAQMGHQMDPKELAQFLKDMEIGGADKLIEQFTKNEAQVNRENLLLAQGQMLPINDYDDDDWHVQRHTDFQKGARYQALNPMIQKMFDTHVALHRKRLSDMQQHQLEMQLQMSGQVPPTMTAAAFQDAQELSNLQGTQQLQGVAQQQGFDQADAQQQQRQSEEDHRQKQRQADELHQHKLSQMQEERQRAAEEHQQRMHQAAADHQQASQQKEQAHQAALKQREQQARQQNQQQPRKAA